MAARIQWTSITPVRRQAPAELETVPELATESAPEISDDDDDADVAVDWRPRIAAIVAIALAIGWVALAGAARWPVLAASVTVDSVSAFVAFIAPPLVLIAMGYALAVRTSRSETARFARVSQGLRTEQARLEAVLAHVTARVTTERDTISAATAALTTIGDDAGVRLAATGETLRHDIAALAAETALLRRAAGDARGDIDTLMTDVPRAHAETQAMRATLDAAGMRTLEHTAALDAQIAALVVRAREADEVAGGAAQKLSAQLARVEGTSASAGAHLVGAAGTMTDAIDAALVRAAEAADAARRGMEAQGGALLALVEQGEAALARTGAEAADAVSLRVATVRGQVEALGDALDTHATRGSGLVAALGDDIAQVEQRLVVIDEGAATRHVRLSEALDSLADKASALGRALETGDASATGMIGRVETLMTALDAVLREIDETLPAAFARVNARAEESRTRIAGVAPEIDAVERAAGATLDRLIEAEAVLAKQTAAFAALGDDARMRLAAAQAAASDLVAAVEGADARATVIADGAGARLIDTMVRVRETAQAAADRARSAIEDVIPQSTERLSTAVGTVLAQAVGDGVETRLRELNTAAETAVASANRASDRLMRQMLTIAETSAQVEARIAEAHAEIEEADTDSFARRVALLIESLNSTAIDVTKILGSEVADGAWAAYLKGDRGVFTRRAVRLLDSGEAREIARVYADDGIFREQVNRYVHDFEAMLRNILATRNGAPLGVTLLSSDMGKLYVALAQAIERLRG